MSWAVWIPSYKPLRNVQDRLRTVRERFEEGSELRAFVLMVVADGDVPHSEIGPEVDPPNADWPMSRRARLTVPDVNLTAIESSSWALGRAGEESVVAAERKPSDRRR
ncbi:hypothetical protein GCM10007979_04400 [Nocardioides albus]|uniref:Uncharacterized protein n=1 Tax=Nocardioides albus TaxID=1841 RepID=A0A7W5A132_9ACTN|nr:hypothetical protein [Nocardioides albus]GGU09564.1 hypothetical protein GCM10007979_04400 [Nocardioides albus]